MADPLKQVRVSIAPPTEPKNLPPPTFVSFVWVDRVNDDVQLLLCDMDYTQFRLQAESPKASEIPIPLVPMQKVFLSKNAIRPLHETLTKIIESWDTEK